MDAGQVGSMIPVPGTTYTLAEDDYRYGSGPLLVKVTQVGRPVEYGGEPWWEVEAMVKPPGTVGLAYPRRLYLLARALRA